MHTENFGMKNKVNEFLYVLNTMIDGLKFSNSPFEYQISNQFISLKFKIELEFNTITGFWSPSDEVVKMITESVQNNFNLKDKINWNNTKTIFWFMAKI